MKKLPRITVPVGVSWGTEFFKEKRQETEQSCPSWWWLVQIWDWSSNCCKPCKEAGMAWGVFERSTRQTSLLCAFGRLQSWRFRSPEMPTWAVAFDCCHDKKLQEHSGWFSRAGGSIRSVQCHKLLLPVEIKLLIWLQYKPRTLQ